MRAENTGGLTAIEALREENLRNRTATIEAELVRLRAEYGKTLSSKNAVSNICRPTVTDVFAGIRGLPEIAADELTGSTIAAGILHHGALLVRGLYRAPHLQRLAELVASQEEANRGDNAPLACTPTTFFNLLEIYRESGLLSAVATYLDGQPLLLAERTKLRHYRVEKDMQAAIPWHQDINFFGKRTYAVNCWAAVTSCGAGNPGLGIIPTGVERRFGWKEEDGLAPLDYSRGAPPDLFGELIAEHPAVYPVLEPGDALLFDEMTVHRTAGKVWKLSEQIVTVGWFFRPSGFPEWGTPLAV